MWLVFLLVILILGILYSSIEANLYHVEFSEKIFNFRLKISLKLFGILKIFSIDLDKVGIKLLKKKIPYKNFIDKSKLSKLNNKETFEILRKLHVKLKKAYFNLKVGLIDIALTNIAIIIISSICPLLLKNKVKKEKFKYEVLPEYNKLYFHLKGNLSISIRTLTLTNFYFKNIKAKFAHNKDKNYGLKESF